MRYFFNVRNDDHLIEDKEGSELNGMDAVRREAFVSAQTLMAERLRFGEPVDIGSVFEVKDEVGEVVHVLPYATVLLSSLAPPPMALLGRWTNRD